MTAFETDMLEKTKKQTEAKTEGFARDLSTNLKSYSSTAVESLSEGYDSALSWVKKNPIQAAAIGAGIGFLLGTAIRRYTRKD